jgi:hypothetical protein
MRETSGAERLFLRIAVKISRESCEQLQGPSEMVHMGFSQTLEALAWLRQRRAVKAA